MSGERLKQILGQAGMSFAEISRRLDEPPQYLLAKFKTEDVSTSTLERLAEVLKKDISWFYSGEPFGAAIQPLTAENTTMAQLVNMLAKKERECEELRAQLHAQNTSKKKCRVIQLHY